MVKTKMSKKEVYSPGIVQIPGLSKFAQESEKKAGCVPPGSGAFAEVFYAGFSSRESNRDIQAAKSVKEFLGGVGFGFNQRPWLVPTGSLHLPKVVAEQIQDRAAILPDLLYLGESLMEILYGKPLERLGLPSRNVNTSQANIVRFDDMLTPDGNLVATELEGWSSGQGQITALGYAYHELMGQYGIATYFPGIDSAAVKALRNTFGPNKKIAVIIPHLANQSGWDFFLQKDFELFAGYCQNLGLDVVVDQPSNLYVDGSVSGKYGKYDVLYPFFPPTGFMDPEVTGSVGAKIVYSWVGGNVELFPEPSWLQTKMMPLVVLMPHFEPQLTELLMAKYNTYDRSWAKSYLSKLKATASMVWGWPLDPESPPVLPGGKRVSWDELAYKSATYFPDGVVLKPLFSTDCSGLVMPGEMSTAEFAKFMKLKLGSFAGQEPYPTSRTTLVKHDRVGTNFEIDMRNYMMQAKVPLARCTARYLNNKENGIKVATGLGARICTTVFIDKDGQSHIGDVDATLRKPDSNAGRIHGATDSLVTIVTFSGYAK